MKSIKSFIVILVCFASFNACNIDENPTTFFSESSIFSSDEGAQTAVNGMYYAMSSFEYYGSGYVNLVLPVSGLFYSSQAANTDATGLNTTPANINLTSMWAGMYQAINAANVIIKNMEGSTAFKNRDAILGHAYFVRGHTYLNLFRFFGGVPLHTKPVTPDALHIKRSTKQEVVDLIIADLTKAKSLMLANDTYIKGRPSKWAASVYLAKLYMFLAPQDASNWAKAKAELTEVISSKQYSLVPKYSSLFELGTENTKESVFEIQYGHTGAIRTSDHSRLFTPAGSTFSPANTVTFGRLRPNKEVYDDHVKRYPTDPRIAATFLFDSYPRYAPNAPQNIYPKSKTGNNGWTCIRKWMDASYNGTTTERNYILCRYADVLLMMAEVVNEVDGPDAAYQYVNQVLARARDANGDGNATPDATHPANWSGMTKDVFRERIMYERRYELLSEGEEWFDTRRRGYQYFLDNVITLHNNNPTFDATRDLKYPTAEKNMLLPIPLSEMSGNQAVTPADQNPGY
jgi:hypothetical protein